ncbi:MAG: hypothetical protein HQK76_06010 [Desulfobacterales bacterium]|nr:hypothetical protein [Desulfobacterales bacterium]
MDCIKLGIQGYIVKPPNPDEITLKILSYYKKVDPEKATNAKLEIARIDDNPQPQTPAESFTKEESEYIEEFKMILKGKVVNDTHRKLLKKLAEKLKLSDERISDLENAVLGSNQQK